MTTSKSRHIKIRSAEETLARLENVSGPQAFDELMELLDHDAWPVRKRAAAVLAKLGPGLVEKIKERFLTLSEHQRYWSIRVIARVLGSGSLAWLKQLYRSPHPPARGSIISAVGEIPGDEATEFLFGALGDDAWPNRYAASEHLERRGRQIVPFLSKGIGEGSGDGKHWCLRLLVRVLKEEGLPLLSQCFDSNDQTLRYYAVRAVSESDEPWALTVLTRALGDHSWTNRQLASHILRGKRKLAVGPVVDALKTGDHDTLFWALKTLAEIGDETAVAPVAQLLGRTDLDPEVREWVVDALVTIRCEGAAKRLFELAVDDETSRARITERLASFGIIAFRPILRYVRSTNDSARALAIRVLASLNLGSLDRLLAEFEALAATRAELLVQGMKKIEPRILEDMLHKGIVTVAKLEEMALEPSPDVPAEPALALPIGRSTVPTPPKIVSVVPSSTPAPGAPSSYPLSFDDLLGRALEQNASDIHLRVGNPPVLRLQGVLATTDLPAMSEAQICDMVSPIVTPGMKKVLARDKELDIGHEIPGISRFRVNVFSEISGIGVVARVIPSRVPSLTDLGHPPIFHSICGQHDGLVLVTGPTGSGKSTTLAAMIDYINESRDEHILTIEDPVEFRHPKKRCLMSYRELGRNCRSFSRALRAALREDPDVILVGELRDRTTIGLAIRAAETGHLVLGTLHTSSAAETVDRIINVFPSAQQANIRTALAGALRAVICQHLVPSVDKKRTAALEILLVNFAVANMIREQKVNQVESAIMAGRKEGMTTRDEHLALLVKQRRIMPEIALEYSCNKQDMEKLLRKL